MSRRIELQSVLEEILGSKNVYFQPPEGHRMTYDCIVYERSRIIPTFANNMPYLFHKQYRVTAIYKNPDSELPEKIAMLPLCAHERHFINDNLHHDVFTLYF